MTFYVIDTADRSLSWSVKSESGEQFTSRKMAEKRAKELADLAPGTVFEIVQTIADVTCPVGNPVVSNR